MSGKWLVGAHLPTIILSVFSVPFFCLRVNDSLNLSWQAMTRTTTRWNEIESVCTNTANLLKERAVEEATSSKEMERLCFLFYPAFLGPFLIFFSLVLVQFPLPPSLMCSQPVWLGAKKGNDNKNKNAHA